MYCFISLFDDNEVIAAALLFQASLGEKLFYTKQHNGHVSLVSVKTAPVEMKASPRGLDQRSSPRVHPLLMQCNKCSLAFTHSCNQCSLAELNENMDLAWPANPFGQSFQ